MKLDTNNPKVMTTEDVSQRTELSVSSLDPASHYVFALLLKKCSATIAASITWTTFGRRRSCPEISVQNAQATNEPASSLTHGTKTNIECNAGFKLEDDYYYYYDVGASYEGVCVDSEWQPPLPSCHVINHCPELITPSTGHLTLKGRQEGSTAHYVCKKGFILDGPQERTCRADGEWVEHDPRCLPMSCVQPPVIDHGEFVPCKHTGRTDIHGTFQDPREGYCIELTCQEHFVESYKVVKVAENPRWQSYGKIPRGARVCKDGEWIGYTDASCKPAARLYPEQEMWHSKIGILQIWKNGDWETASSPDGSENIPCSTMSCVYGNLARSVVITGNPNGVNGVVVTCPKIRFVDTITPYEGKLEVLVRKEWHKLCYADYVTQDHQAEIRNVCEMLGATPLNPTFVPRTMGMTGYTLVCPSSARTM